MAKPVKTGYYRGSEGRDKSDDELAKSKARAEARKESGLQPFRFRVAPGETTQFVVLDDEPDFFRYEHNMKDPATGFYSVFTGCVNEWDNCPICAALGKEPYYAMYLTVIDFTPFSTKDGTQHEFSRKLLVVKPAQQKKFYRQFAKAEKDGRTLRGALFDVVRDGRIEQAVTRDLSQELTEELVRIGQRRRGVEHLASGGHRGGTVDAEQVGLEREHGIARLEPPRQRDAVQCRQSRAGIADAERFADLERDATQCSPRLTGIERQFDREPFVAFGKARHAHDETFARELAIDRVAAFDAASQTGLQLAGDGRNRLEEPTAAAADPDQRHEAEASIQAPVETDHQLPRQLPREHRPRCGARHGIEIRRRREGVDETTHRSGDRRS